MVEQRKERRSPASLKVKYKSSSVEQFVAQFSADVSRGGIFLKTKTPLEVGALIKLELQLSDASAVINGLGRVCWRRMPGPDPSVPSGMGVRFVNLTPESHAVVDRMIDASGARPSRFEQTQGAEVEAASAAAADAALVSTGGLGALMSTPPPAPASTPSAPAPAVSKTAAATLPHRPPGVQAPVPTPESVQSRGAPSALPQTPARTGPAGLFADSLLVQNPPPETRSESGVRDSFFPPETTSRSRDSDPHAPSAGGRQNALPNRPGMASAATTPTDRGSPGRESKALPFGAFRSSVVGNATAAAGGATRASQAAAAPERDLIDQLFDDVVQASVRPPAASAAPGPTPTPTPIPTAIPTATSASTPAPTPAAIGRITPSRPPTANLDADPWSTLSNVPSSAPSARDSVRSPTPFRTSQPAAPNVAPDEPSEQDFGEADLFGPKSIPAQPAQVSVPPQPTALQEFGSPKRTSPIVWIALVVIAALGGGGYYYFAGQQQQAAGEVQPELPASAPPKVEPAVAPAAPPTAPAAEAAPEPAAPTPEPAAAPAAPAGPVEDIEMEVTSLPRGADVLIDGNPTGATPMRIRVPLGRTVQITARSAGFASSTQTLTATKNPEPLRFNLEPLPYAITVRTVPPEAELGAGARTAIAPGPLELGHLDGVVQVSVSKPGFQRMSRLVRLDEFTEQDGVMRAEIDVSLSALPGTGAKPESPRKPKKPAPKKSKAAGAASAADSSGAPGAPAKEAAQPDAPKASPLLEF